MNKKYLIRSLLLVFIISAGQSIGQNANETSTAGNNTIADEAEAPLNGTASENGNVTNSDVVDLKYIWSVDGIESDKITMVLNQDGKDIFGQAKYEPEGGKAWNGEVVGSVEGNDVELTLSAQKDKEMVTTKLTGVFDSANQTIGGSFTQVNQGKVMNKGTFSAMWISPDTSSYTPAIIEEEKPVTPAPAAVNTTAVETETSTTKKSRFVDIHEYADKIGLGGDISGIPPGMGGVGGTSGAGGSE
ncbi:Uncharacterised protein [uncultured archaeon]|nr:Uncharacterised protein [uncultured archaeon]